MRGWGIALVGLLAPGVVRADDRLEASGFVGYGWFTDNTELGNSWAPEQVPTTAPVLGGRLGWIAWRGPGVALAVEGELSIATSFTGAKLEGGSERMAYFAPVFGWRGHAALRVTRWTLRPHLVAGAGGETIASSSPFMSKETDPVVYWGPGLALPLTARWQARVDLRHGIMAGRDDGLTSTFELQLGVGATLGGGERPRPAPVIEEPVRVADVPEPPKPPPPDPAPDPDGDGLTGEADRCPLEGEDKDGFADDDGCVDPDNDHDLIEDVRDACPDVAETVNGFDDTDGCADGIPKDVTDALAAKVPFAARSAKLSPEAQAALQPMLAVLTARPDVRIVVTGHPDQAATAALAKRRAEAVKWFLVDRGIAEDRITTATGAAGTAPIELALAPQ